MEKNGGTLFPTEHRRSAEQEQHEQGLASQGQHLKKNCWIIQRTEEVLGVTIQSTTESNDQLCENNVSIVLAFRPQFVVFRGVLYSFMPFWAGFATAYKSE